MDRITNGDHIFVRPDSRMHKKSDMDIKFYDGNNLLRQHYGESKKLRRTTRIVVYGREFVQKEVRDAIEDELIVFPERESITVLYSGMARDDKLCKLEDWCQSNECLLTDHLKWHERDDVDETEEVLKTPPEPARSEDWNNAKWIAANLEKGDKFALGEDQSPFTVIIRHHGYFLVERAPDVWIYHFTVNELAKNPNLRMISRDSRPLHKKVHIGTVLVDIHPGSEQKFKWRVTGIREPAAINVSCGSRSQTIYPFMYSWWQVVSL